MKSLMESLVNEEMFDEIIQDEKMTVLVFSANWCPDCTFIQPFMPNLIKRYADYRFVYVDRDQFVDLCVQLNVLGIPSFVAYKQGQEVNRLVSKFRKTEKEIDAFLGGLQ